MRALLSNMTNHSGQMFKFLSQNNFLYLNRWRNWVRKTLCHELRTRARTSSNRHLRSSPSRHQNLACSWLAKRSWAAEMTCASGTEQRAVSWRSWAVGRFLFSGHEHVAGSLFAVANSWHILASNRDYFGLLLVSGHCILWLAII
jgi:hypothetical protein